jgi:secondary thiamine-phosphate synthase enzyme
MKVFQKSVYVQTKGKDDIIEITDDIQRVAIESKVKNGMVFINSLHNTAAIILQENDPTIHKDLLNLLERLVPLRFKYEHDYESNVNATAHLKSNLLGSFLTIPLKDGKLVTGTWQTVLFIELFEPRRREVVVTVIGD